MWRNTSSQPKPSGNMQDRYKQMSQQECLIEKKKREIEEKLAKEKLKQHDEILKKQQKKKHESAKAESTSTQGTKPALASRM